MKKLILIIVMIMSLFTIQAQSVSNIMNNVLSEIKNNHNITANFEVASSQYQAKGSIIISSSKFRILTNDFKCWYDGKTQWIYSSITNEVNIIEPSEDELKLSNPFFAVMDYSNNYNAVLKTKEKAGYIIELTAKNSNIEIKKITLTIDSDTYRIVKAIINMNEGDTQIVKLGNYNVNNSISDITFVYDDKYVPKGTPLIDLR